jgi:hypothetical protein
MLSSQVEEDPQLINDRVRFHIPSDMKRGRLHMISWFLGGSEGISFRGLIHSLLQEMDHPLL